MFVANLFQYWMFAVSGEHLTFRLRRLFFQALLRQEIGWFDDRRHSMGVLSTKLSTEVALVEGITGQRLGMVAQLAGTIVGGLLIAFFSIWQLALVILACVPVVRAGRQRKGEGRRRMGGGRRRKGGRKTEEGQGKKEEGRGKTEEGRVKTEEGRWKGWAEA